MKTGVTNHAERLEDVVERWEQAEGRTGSLAGRDIEYLLGIARAAWRYHDERHHYPLARCHHEMCRALGVSS